VKLPKLRRGAPAAGDQPRRRRSRRQNAPGTIIPGAPASGRAPRPDGPRTIVPVIAPATPLARDLDAARARLRRDIPPVPDEDE
jgi:hypothetical protein